MYSSLLLFWCENLIVTRIYHKCFFILFNCKIIQAFLHYYSFDIKSVWNSHDQKGIQQLLCDCEHRFINKIITKSISRFACNTADIISVLNKLRVLGVDVFF